MEEMDDDDFGDLYADVEALVSSVINGGGGGSGGGGGRDITDTNNNNHGGGGGATEKCDIGGGDGEIRGMEVNGVDEEEERVSLDEGSDSEDDLNIVLNEDDFRPVGVPVNGGNRNGGFVGGGGNGNGNGKGDDFVVGGINGIGSDKNHGVKLEQVAVRCGNGRKGVSRPSAGILHYKYITRRARTRAFRSTAKGNRFVGAKGDWKNSQRNGDKFSGSSQVARFKVPQKRTRTILNANIDKFEQKPWRNSGVDVTDFFNFGFNEQSWKDYCSSVHQLRQQTSMQTRIPAYDYSKYYQAPEPGVQYEEMSEEGMADETAQAGQGRTDSPDPNYVRPPKGRAIQVEGSIGERQSSMDVKHPLGLDPDVVIQITGQDTRKKYSGSEKKELDHKYTALQEASENGEFGIAANKDTYSPHSPHSAGGDKLSTESLEGSIRTSDRHAAALRRCSKQGVSFNPTYINSDNRGNGQLSDLERKHHNKFQFSEGNAKAMESLSMEKEVVHRNIHKKDPCMMETESSYGGQVQLSPSLSCYGSQSEASDDDVHVGPGETQKPFRRPSQNSVTELRESNEPGYNLLRDSDSNNIRGKPGYFKESARRNKSPIQERQNLCSMRPHGEADGGGESPMSDKEVLYTKDHSHAIRGRQHGRLHGFGSYHKEETSFYKEKYHNERFSDGHFRNANFRRPYMKHHPRFKNEAGPYFKRKFSDRGNFHDRRTTMGRDWYHRGRGVFNKDIDCPMHRERKWVSKFSFYRNKGKDPQWRRGDGHYFNKRNEGGDPWLEYGHADGFMQGKNRRAVPFTDRGCDCSDERCSQYAGSKVKNFGRGSRFDDSPTSDMDYSRFKGLKNNSRRHVDRQLVSSRFHRESHTMDGGRWPDTESPGDDVDHLRSTDEHGRARRGAYAERCRDGDRCDSFNDGDDAENGITSPSNQVPSGRSGYYKQSKAFHLAEDELFSRHKDDKFYDEEASFSNKKISRAEQIHATNRSSHGRMVMDENLTEQHRYEMIRERNGAHFFNSSSNPTCSVKYEQTVLTCRDSVDLVVGKGKSSEKRTEAGNVMCNDKLENMGSERDEEHTTSMEFNELQIEKVEIGSNQEIDEWLDKFPVLEDNEALDLEEGQIVTDELDLDFLMEDDHALENASPTGNVRERMFDNENAANMNEVFGGIDQDRILESLAKMEKRRERFKEPLTLRKEQPDKNPEPQVDPEIETAETNQHRPSRKRLWGGSYSPLHIGNSEHQVFFNET